MVLFQPGLLCDSGDLLRDAVLSAVPLNWQVAGFSAMLTDSTSFAKVSIDFKIDVMDVSVLAEWGGYTLLFWKA